MILFVGSSEHKAKLVPGFTRQYDVTLLVYVEIFEQCSKRGRANMR